MTDMLLKEYDEEFHISCEKKISYEDGIRQGDAHVEEARQETEENYKFLFNVSLTVFTISSIIRICWMVQSSNNSAI